MLVVFKFMQTYIYGSKKSKIGENVRLSKSYAVCCTFIF